MNEPDYLTVKQLNTYIKSLFESDLHLVNVTVKGEISNFKNHYQSGHWYFTVKDSESAIRCVMFRTYASRVSFAVEDGMQVILRGRVSVYEKDGQYMLYVSSMEDFGTGELALLFAKTKEKLQYEGLFDSDKKRPLPSFPKRIAVITSDTGAAVEDLQNILNMRYPLCDVVLCPVLVQGTMAAQSIIGALDRVYLLKGIDLIILGRGGGSAEDLAAFNDEALARKIFDSPVPVISAVGHETDFTISDFVADLRASTPSHAAELAVPDMCELLSNIDRTKDRLKNVLTNRYSISLSRYENARYRISYKRFYDYLEGKSQSVDNLFDKLTDYENRRAENKENAFKALAEKLDALSPLKVLTRGFAAVKTDKGYIKSVSSVSKGDSIKVKFFDGAADCTVNKTISEDKL